MVSFMLSSLAPPVAIGTIHFYFPPNPFESFKSWFYSALKLFTGFIKADLTE